MPDCLSLLTEGDIWGGIVCPFTTLFPDGWFYAIMLFALEIGMFVKYENLLGPSVFGILIGLLMLPLLPPAAWTVPILVLIVNFASVMYAVIFRGE
jgi:hypothetical protein